VYVWEEGEEEEQDPMTGCKRCGSCIYIFYKGDLGKEIASSCFVIFDYRCCVFMDIPC